VALIGYIEFLQSPSFYLLYLPTLASVYVTVNARRLVNPSIYHSEVVKVRKMLVNASISGFYQTNVVIDSIYEHQLVEARYV
jgi:hypothetical protein